MCGRFTLNATAKDLAMQFKLLEEPSWHPRYNIAPAQSSLLILEQGESRIARNGNWGFKAPWSRSGASSKLLINARGETAAEKKTFRDAYLHRRCLVPANSFFEWQTLSGQKLPWLFHLPNRPCFAMAGLWQEVESAAGSSLAFTILTLPSCGKISQIHPRMPWILGQEEERSWLNDMAFRPPTGGTSAGVHLARYRVSPQINRVAFDQPSCLDPVAEEERLF